ncbi:NB-ARC domain-containing protein [Streptomyces sp. NPDC050504]|uniref:NB-ARC domain-containing protein n=1 Tax=Streptomyces sp. NPDC050504 TaxID=3365618 RepID=UPI00379BBFF1
MTALQAIDVDPRDIRHRDEFVAQLRRLKSRTGLSYRDIERHARRRGHILPLSTVYSALNRGTLPHVDLLAALLLAFDLPEGEVARWLGAHRTLTEEPGTAAPCGSTGAPCLLPPIPLPLIGRDGEVDAAAASLLEPNRAPRCLVIAGPAGVGKTALAVHLGHRLIDDFPDGQLYADLGGFHESAVDPKSVLSLFLRALGAHPSTVPRGMDGRVALYRTLLSRRRVLVVLDNVAESHTVRALLPNGLECRAVVTTRATLADLCGSHLSLAPLGPDDATALLGRAAGIGRVTGEEAAADEIAALCGNLPLALCVAGARLAARPHMRLRDMARALSDEDRRLDELTVGDIAVRRRIALSYRFLTTSGRRALRLMSMCGDAEFTGRATAALFDVGRAEADLLLDQLLELHLIEARTAPGGGTRFHVSPLVAAFARERSLGKDEDGHRGTSATQRN